APPHGSLLLIFPVTSFSFSVYTFSLLKKLGSFCCYEFDFKILLINSRFCFVRFLVLLWISKSRSGKSYFKIQICKRCVLVACGWGLRG
ncbi:unnamed protein product, partial [Brassica rapa subsp. trilocularis]